MSWTQVSSLLIILIVSHTEWCESCSSWHESMLPRSSSWTRLTALDRREGKEAVEEATRRYSGRCWSC